MNVGSFAHSSSKASCQYPPEARSFEKQREPASFASTCGIVGIMYISRWTTLFSCLRSIQILTLSGFFSAATIGAHRVRSVMFLITPSLSILLSSLSTLGSNGIGTRRATFTWYDVAFSLILMLTGEVTDPRKQLCLCLDSVNCTSFTLFVRHTGWKCPILSHFLSRAGHISSGL